MIRHLERPKNHFKLAIGLILLADLFTAMQAIFVKLALPGLGFNTLFFIRWATLLIVLYGWLLLTKGGKGFKNLYKTNAWRYHLVRSVSGVGSIYCFYYGLSSMPIGSATLLYYTFPIFIPIIARVWLKIALVHSLWWGIGISFLGILFILHPGADLFNPAVFLLLLGALLGAIAIVAMRVLHRTEESKTILAHFFTLGTIVSGVIFFSFQDLSKDFFTQYNIGMALCAGLSAAGFQVFMTLASKYAPARFLSPFIYGIFIFASLGGYWIWGERVQRGDLIGFLLICLGAISMIVLYPKNDLIFVEKKKRS